MPAPIVHTLPEFFQLRKINFDPELSEDQFTGTVFFFVRENVLNRSIKKSNSFLCRFDLYFEESKLIKTQTQTWLDICIQNRKCLSQRQKKRIPDSKKLMIQAGKYCAEYLC